MTIFFYTSIFLYMYMVPLLSLLRLTLYLATIALLKIYPPSHSSLFYCINTDTFASENL